MIGVETTSARSCASTARARTTRFGSCPTSDCSREGDRSYFKETIKLRPGEIYVSPLDLDRRSTGLSWTPHSRHCGSRRRSSMPTASCSASLSSMSTCGRLSTASGHRCGRVKTSTSSMSRGDYLVHPDRAREFGSELGKPTNWQSDFPSSGVVARQPRRASGISCRIRTDGRAESRSRRPFWPAMNGSR